MSSPTSLDASRRAIREAGREDRVAALHRYPEEGLCAPSGPARAQRPNRRLRLLKTWRDGSRRGKSKQERGNVPSFGTRSEPGVSREPLHFCPPRAGCDLPWVLRIIEK